MSVSSFFFSSRRRHTRYWRDWSSDVCSSDLELLKSKAVSEDEERRAQDEIQKLTDKHIIDIDKMISAKEAERSEERRVGKECRSRWAQCRYKKKGRIESRARPVEADKERGAQ